MKCSTLKPLSVETIGADLGQPFVCDANERETTAVLAEFSVVAPWPAGYSWTNNAQ
jgi:hypothetical protein